MIVVPLLFYFIKCLMAQERKYLFYSSLAQLGMGPALIKIKFKYNSITIK